MRPFPKVLFDVLVPQGTLVAGRRSDAILTVTTADDLSGAESIDLLFRSQLLLEANNVQVASDFFRQDIFLQKISVVPPARLTAGMHRFPFQLDLPAGLPPAFVGNGIMVVHELLVDLDVVWAIDPHAELRPNVTLPPRAGEPRPLTLRSPRDLHPSITLEVQLDSSVVVHGEPVLGSIRLVSGAERDLEGVQLSLVSRMHHLTGRKEPRQSQYDSRVFLPGLPLLHGQTSRFEVPLPSFVPPSFENSLLRHMVVLVITLVRERRDGRAFEIPIEVLPAGSFVAATPATMYPMHLQTRWQEGWSSGCL